MLGDGGLQEDLLRQELMLGEDDTLTSLGQILGRGDDEDEDADEEDV